MFENTKCSFFVVITMLLIVSCDEEYPFEDFPHVSYFDLKGKVREIRISAEISDYNDKYSIFKKANLACISIPHTIPLRKYFFEDNIFPLSDFKNINMYIMPISELYHPLLNRASDIAISFDDGGRIITYEVYDLDKLVFECSFNFEKSILKTINKKSVYANVKFGSCEYVLGNNDTIEYVKVIDDKDIEFKYFDNLYLKERVDYLSNTDSVLSKYNYSYAKKKNFLLQIIDLNINEKMERKGCWRDSVYVFLDEKDKAYKATYFSNDVASNVLFKEDRVVSLLPDKETFEREKYDDKGRIVKLDNYYIEYDYSSGLVKSIEYKYYANINITYTCKYEYDLAGNWTELVIEPDDKSYYRELLKKMSVKEKRIDELNSVLKDCGFSEIYKELIREKQDLLMLEYIKECLWSAYFKLIIKRKINYYD